jgi:hypothetical protein
MNLKNFEPSSSNLNSATRKCYKNLNILCSTLANIKNWPTVVLPGLLFKKKLRQVKDYRDYTDGSFRKSIQKSIFLIQPRGSAIHMGSHLRQEVMKLEDQILGDDDRMKSSGQRNSVWP